MEKDLGAKIDDMMRSIEQMGQVMGAQVRLLWRLLFSAAH